MKLVSIACGALVLLLSGSCAHIEGQEPLKDRDPSAGDTWVMEDGVRVFHVDAFGAVPDGKTDSGPAIRQAFEAALQVPPPTEVRFSAGRYLASPIEGDEGRTFVLEDARELTIAGEGADQTELVLTDPRAGGFAFMRGREILVRDLAMDHDPLPFTQGKIVAIDRGLNSFDVLLEDRYPVLDAPWFADELIEQARWGFLFDGETREIKANTPDFTFIDRAELVEGRTFRVFPVESEAPKLEHFQVGDLWVQLIRPITIGNFFFWQTEDSGIENVTIYAGQSIAVVGYGALRPFVRDSEIRVKPGTNRLISTNADGWHFQQVRGGPLIENTYIERICDDAIAINNFPAPILAVEEPNVVIASAATMLRRGDRVYIFNPRDGRILQRATILELEESDDEYRVVLNKPVSGVTTRQDNAELPDQLMNMSAASSGFVVRNNTFRMHRRHALFIQANEGLIEGNDIRGSQGLGIIVNNEPSWPVGPIPHEVVIRNNHVENVGNDLWYTRSPYGAAIKVQGSKFPLQPADEQLIRDIEIVGNTIINPPGTGIFVGSTQDVRVEGNRISITDRSIPEGFPAIDLHNVSGEVVENNEVSDPEGGFSSPVRKGP